MAHEVSESSSTRRCSEGEARWYESKPQRSAEPEDIEQEEAGRVDYTAERRLAGNRATQEPGARHHTREIRHESKSLENNADRRGRFVGAEWYGVGGGVNMVHIGNLGLHTS